MAVMRSNPGKFIMAARVRDSGWVPLNTIAGFNRLRGRFSACGATAGPVGLGVVAGATGLMARCKSSEGVTRNGRWPGEDGGAVAA
jgi:hypothetical protein